MTDEEFASTVEASDSVSAKRIKTLEEAVTNFLRYEYLRAEWIDGHENATPMKYTATMRKIARQCGV